jgi:hypothetical protein
MLFDGGEGPFFYLTTRPPPPRRSKYLTSPKHPNDDRRARTVTSSRFATQTYAQSNPSLEAAILVRPEPVLASKEQPRIMKAYNSRGSSYFRDTALSTP